MHKKKTEEVVQQTEKAFAQVQAALADTAREVERRLQGMRERLGQREPRRQSHGALKAVR